MTEATISKKIEKTTGEMQDLVRKSKRKLLELEVVLSLAEIKKGKFETFKNGSDLIKKLK